MAPERSAAAIRDAFLSGRRSAVQITADCLARATAAQRFNVFSRVLETEALAAARALDRRLAAGLAMPALAGVPFVAKNLFDLRGHPTLAGAAPRQADAPAARDAAVLRALLDAGAVPIGLTHMDEYACGATGESVIGGAVRNPWDPSRITGGSSAGTAAAIAAGVVPLGLGSDTNGSIRAPAAFCGIWGLRPGTGRLSTQGCFPYAESLDAAGPMAADAGSLALAWRALRGGASDALVSGHGRLRIGVLRAGFAEHAEPQAWNAVLRVAAAFTSARMIDLPDVDRARDAASIISAYEVARNHLRHGFAGRHAGYSAMVRQRMLAGLALPDDWYRTAQAWRRVWRARMQTLFQGVDLLLTCATPYAAPPVGAERLVGEQGRIYAPRADAGHMTRPVSLAGLPVVAAPVAVPGADMPLGVQLIGPPGGEAPCLAAAMRLEEEGVCGFPAQPRPADGR